MKKRLGFKLLVGSLVLAGVAMLVACSGEDRPDVDVIEDGTPSGTSSGSVSGSGPLPTSAPGAESYQPVSNVDIYFAMALDLNDMRDLMAPATEGGEVDWDAVSQIYENGKNQTHSDGTLRSLASVANEEVLSLFPNGEAVYGRDDFINAIVRDGIEGTGRGEGLSDNARRQIVDKGVQMLLYAKALQELEAGRNRVADGDTDDASGAPHAVDEAWAATAGAANEDGAFPHGLLQTASSRESNFGLDGRLRAPLEAAFVAALEAARAGDLAAFDESHAQIKGHLNSIFYLASLRYVSSAAADESAEDRQVHLAEGWAFFQAIRAQVAAGSTEAATSIESFYTRSADQEATSDDVETVYAALNDPTVLESLGVPDNLTVLTPPN